MHTRNNLNARYRNGFLVAPTIPWSKAALADSNIGNILDLAQNTITSILVSYHKNQGRAFEPSVELVLPMNLAADSATTGVNQGKIAEAYAYVAGLTPGSVVIDMSSILELNSDVRRRRPLLYPDEGAEVAMSSFNMIISFEGNNLPQTLQAAADFRLNIEDETSLQSKSIKSLMNTMLLEQISTFVKTESVLDRSKSIESPRAIETCLDDKEWEIDVTTLLNLDIGVTTDGLKKVGYVGCGHRSIYAKDEHGKITKQHAENKKENVKMRGPLEHREWLSVSPEHVLDAEKWMYGWDWWDLCATPPVIPGYHPDFSTQLSKILGQASDKCCLCNKVPKISGTSKIYKHAYSWPIVLHNDAIYNVYTRLTYPVNSNLLSDIVFKMNLQLRNFRLEHGAAISLFDVTQAYNGNTLPPLSWTLDDVGRTVVASCGKGQWLSGLDWCDLCAAGSFKPDDLVQFNVDADHYKQGAGCTVCPLNSV